MKIRGKIWKRKMQKRRKKKKGEKAVKYEKVKIKMFKKKTLFSVSLVYLCM